MGCRGQGMRQSRGSVMHINKWLGAWTARPTGGSQLATWCRIGGRKTVRGRFYLVNPGGRFAEGSNWPPTCNLLPPDSKYGDPLLLGE